MPLPKTPSLWHSYTHLPHWPNNSILNCYNFSDSYWPLDRHANRTRLQKYTDFRNSRRFLSKVADKDGRWICWAKRGKIGRSRLCNRIRISSSEQRSPRRFDSVRILKRWELALGCRTIGGKVKGRNRFYSRGRLGTFLIRIFWARILAFGNIRLWLNCRHHLFGFNMAHFVRILGLWKKVISVFRFEALLFGFSFILHGLCGLIILYFCFFLFTRNLWYFKVLKFHFLIINFA